jgi:hypothetical protein|nr:MAG TPA: hypothetical protein [Caudoviricetes sp.]
MLDEKNKKINNNLNSKMRVGTYVHPLFHSIVGDTLYSRGKNIIDPTEYNASDDELKERFGTTPVFIDTEDHNLKLKYKIPYNEFTHTRSNKDWVDIPISIKDTFYGLSYVANKEYLFKAHARITHPTMQIHNYLIANEYKFPIFIKDDNIHENIKNISINNLEIEIDNTFSNNFYHGANPYNGLQFPNMSPVYVHANRYRKHNINAHSGRHLRYTLASTCTFDTKNNNSKVLSKVEYSSMVYDTLVHSNRNLSRHLTWDEWNDMRCARSSFYPLPMQVTFELNPKFERNPSYEMIYDGMYKQVGYIVVRTFRGQMLFRNPGGSGDYVGYDIPNRFSIHDLKNDNYLSDFDILFRIPKNIPSIIFTTHEGQTYKRELLIVSPQWFKSDQLLPSDIAEPSTSAKVYPDCGGVITARTSIFNDDDVYRSNANVINYLKTLDMNAFLLPAERSVMEWHNRDEI